MCEFVAVGISNQRSTAPAIFQRSGLSAWPARNPFLRSFFHATDTIFWVTSGGCSCDLYVEEPPSVDDRDLRAKYQRKGWSLAKTERAVEAKRKRSPLPRPKLDAFRMAVDALVREVGEMRLHAHFYSGSQQEEAIPEPRARTMTLAEFLARQGTFPRDTLVAVNLGDRHS